MLASFGCGTSDDSCGSGERGQYFVAYFDFRGENSLCEQSIWIRGDLQHRLSGIGTVGRIRTGGIPLESVPLAQYA